MRNLKRTLSLALASVMLVGMMSVGASAVNASDFTDADEIVNKDAVSTMTALGIINGKEDGSYFDPTGNVTRAEMAKMLCVAINGGVDPVLGVKDTPTFTDIKGTWAESYIEYCAANGIIAGRGNNKFDPTGTVSATEAAKMLLGVLGYSAEKSGLVGNDWAINTNVLANQNGLYKKLSNLNANTLLTRDNAAQMIYNALDADMVELNAAGNYTTSQYSYTGTESVVTGTERVWVLTIKENNCTDSGIKAAVDALSGSVYNSRSDADETVKEVAGAEFNKVKYALEQKTQNVYGENTVTKYADETMGHKYLSLITDGDAVLTDVEKDSKGTYTLYMNGITTKGQYTKVEGDYSNLIGQKVEVLYKDRENVYGVYASTDSSLIVESTAGKVGTLSNNEVKIDGTTYKVDSNVTTTALYTGKLIDGLTVGGNKAAAVKAYDNDDNGKIDTVVYVPFTAAKVSYVGEKSFNTDVSTNVKFEDVNAYDDMAKNDYVIKSDAANTVDDTDTYVLAETVKGKIEATKSDSVRIDGTWYNYVTTTPDKDLALDSTVKAAVLNGYIVKSEVVTSSHELQDYAVVVKTDSDINGPQAKLLFADGTTKVVTTDKKYTDTMGLVTYEVKKGEYVLTEAKTNSGDADKAGFDLIVTGKYVNSSGKGKIGGERIADDAVIFVKDSAGKFSTMAGSDFAKYSTTSVVDKNITAYANKDNSTGYNSIVLAYVELNAKVNSITSNYGYVTSAVSTTKNKDGETVSSFTFWDGATEHKDIMTDEKVSLSKGDIFTYEENKDGSYTVTEVDNLLRTAIIAYNEKNGDIRFTDASLSDKGSNVNAEITKDTVIIGINSDDKAGVAGAVPTIAIETAASGVYQANAYYVMGAGDEVKLLVVDTYGNIPAVDSVITVTDPSNLNDAWNEYTDVRLDASKISKPESVNVPAGKTLTLTGTNATNKLTVTVEKGATLDVKGGESAATLDVTVKAGGVMNVPNGKLIGGSDAPLSADADVTVKETSNGGWELGATSGTITVNSNTEFGAKDAMNITGTAKIVGGKTGVTVKFDTATTMTAMPYSSFFKNDGNASTASTACSGAGDLQNKTCVWGSYYTDASNNTATGWVQQ